MPTLAITVNATNPDEADRRAMNMIIDQENQRRAALAPELPQLPNSTAAERKTSYETILAAKVAELHKVFINEAGEQTLLRDIKPRWQISTDAQRAAAASQLAPLP